MSLVVVGLDQANAPLALLEKVAISEEELAKALVAVARRPGLSGNLSEVVVLSTCQRFEIFAVVDRFHEAVDDLRAFVAERADTPVEELADAVSVLFDDYAVVHLFEVSAGLHSTVVGEHEILGQVRRAVERAADEHTAGPVLGALFRKAISAGRRVRADTRIATGTTSLSQVALSLAAEHLGGTLAERTVVVVGAGEMGEGVTRSLGKGGAGFGTPGRVVVTNRTPGRAKGFARDAGATVVDMGELPGVVAEADAVIVTTGAGVPLLGADVLGTGRAGSGAHRRPLVVVDLGMPRNVDPEARSVPGLVLLDMDDLREHVDRTLSDRRSTVEQVASIVRDEVDGYHADARARGAGPAVAALRARLEEIRSVEVARLRARAEAAGEQHDEEYWAHLDEASRAVLAKVLHRPTVALKETAGTPRGERLLEALRAVFDF